MILKNIKVVYTVPYHYTAVSNSERSWIDGLLSTLSNKVYYSFKVLINTRFMLISCCVVSCSRPGKRTVSMRDGKTSDASLPAKKRKKLMTKTQLLVVY